MNRPRFPLLASIVGLGALLSATPAAADVYKIVTPDGRVIYSDQKPSGDSQKQATVIGGAGVQRPMVPPPAAASGPPKLYLPPPQASESGAKQAIVGLGRSAASRDPRLVEGLVTAGGYEILVQGYLETCTGTMPSSLARFDAAVRRWRQANASVLKHAADLRTNLFSPPQQAAIQALAQGRADLILGPAKATSPEPRIRWCDESTDALKGSLLSLDTKASIAIGFEPYVTPP